MSDSDDSVIINKHPFSVRRSDFEHKDTLKYNSIDQYANDDSDNDDDIDDDDKEDQDQTSTGLDSRKRANGYIVQAHMDEIEDLEGEVEVQEIEPTSITESVVFGVKCELLDSDDEADSEETMLKGELMSPVNVKKKSVDSDDE